MSQIMSRLLSLPHLVQCERDIRFIAPWLSKFAFQVVKGQPSETSTDWAAPLAVESLDTT